MDNRDSRNKNQQDPGETEVVGVISPTEAPVATPEPSLAPEETQDPTPAPTSAPTQTPTPTPTETPTITPSPTPTEEDTGDITGTPQGSEDMSEPGQENTGDTLEPEQESTGDTTVPEDQTETNDSVFLDTYNALYTHQGDEYTLVADSNTGSFLIISHKDNSIRQTKYKYAPIYDDTPESIHGPIIGYKNQHFVFLAGNQLVASDGVNETVLKNFENSLEPGFYSLNPVMQSNNRFMVGVEGILVVIDSRDLTIEAYTQGYSLEFFVLTDEILCFSRKDRIPAGPYYNTLYTAQKGISNCLE